MEATLFAIAAILDASFGGPTWSWVLLAVLAGGILAVEAGS